MNTINTRKGHQLYVVGHQQTESLTAGHKMSPSLLSIVSILSFPVTLVCVYAEYWTRAGSQMICDVINNALKIWFTVSAEKLYTSSNDRENILLVSAQWSSNIQLSKQEEQSVFDEEGDRRELSELRSPHTLSLLDAWSISLVETNLKEYV